MCRSRPSSCSAWCGAAETRRWLICGLATGAALLLREDIPIGVAVIGGFLLLSGYRSFPGFVIATVALSYFVYLRFHVMDDAGEWWYPNMYKDLWADGEKGYKSVIKTLITNPLFVLNKLVVEKKLVYLLHLLVPVAFLPARRWYLWAAFVPGIFLTLLVTNYDPPTLFSFHYVMHWAPFLFLAVPLALESIGKSLDSGVVRMRAAATTMVCASLVLTYNYGAFAARANSLKGGYNFIDFEYTPAEAERYRRLQTLVELIPKTPRSRPPRPSARTCLRACRCSPCATARRAPTTCWRRTRSSSCRARARR